jgi:hypothetical protein
MKFGRVTFKQDEGPREIADFVGPGRMMVSESRMQLASTPTLPSPWRGRVPESAVRKEY